MAKTSLVTPVLLVGCLIILASFAIRASFGVFQIPIAQEFGWLRTEFSLAIAIQNLAWGIGQPIFGAIAEKIGDKNAGGMLGGVVGKLGIFSKFLSIGAAAIGGFVTAITTAFKFLMRLGKLEGGLFRTGFFNFAAQDGVAQGIASLGMMATRAGMTMEQAAEFTGQFAKAMDAFGTKSIVELANRQKFLQEQDCKLVTMVKDLRRNQFKLLEQLKHFQI